MGARDFIALIGPAAEGSSRVTGLSTVTGPGRTLALALGGAVLLRLWPR